MNQIEQCKLQQYFLLLRFSKMPFYEPLRAMPLIKFRMGTKSMEMSQEDRLLRVLDEATVIMAETYRAKGILEHLSKRHQAHVQFFAQYNFDFYECAKAWTRRELGNYPGGDDKMAGRRRQWDELFTRSRSKYMQSWRDIHWLLSAFCDCNVF